MNEQMMTAREALEAKERFEAQKLFEARQLLFTALEENDIEITGCGFGWMQADIDIKIDGRNFCVSLTLADLDDEEVMP
jgi:hypothetical protein